MRETIESGGLLVRGDTVIVGVSGGADSLCMLHVLRTLAPEYGVSLHVGHLNHMLRGAEAEADAEYVRRICRAWDLPCTVYAADIATLAAERKLAVEEAGRQERYAFLSGLARELGGRSVAVGHNADDQVETVLMHFLRGSGLAGLRGMRPLSWVDEMRLVAHRRPAPKDVRIRLLRPLLEVPRSDIDRYCRHHDIHPRYDLSNTDQTYYRNRLRHELIPLLETYNPNVREVIRRTARVVTDDYALLRDLLQRTWPTVVRTASTEAIVYDRDTLRSLPLGLQRSVLREGVHRLRHSLRNINWVHIDDALAVVQKGQTGARATLPGGLLLTLGYDAVLLADEAYIPTGDERPRLFGGPIALPPEGELLLPGSAWRVTTQHIPRAELPADWAQNPDPYTAYLDAARAKEPLTLRTRRVGDWLIPLGMAGRQKLGDLMVNVKIPQGERDAVPLLLCGGEIAWVVGSRLDARYAVSAHTHQILVVRFMPAHLLGEES